MAIKKRSAFWSSMHFLLRFLGLNGLVAVAVGLFIWQMLDDDVVQHYTGLSATELGMYVGIGGLCAIALGMLGEVRGLVQATFSNRGFAGINGMFQIALAAFLFGAGNWYAFNHYQRFDRTSNQDFTLPASIRSQLSNLQGETDIIIYLQHVSLGQRVELRQDEYEQAAERVIIKKVKDLTEQFQELGPRFRVYLLDTQARDIEVRREEINALSGELTKDQLRANLQFDSEKPPVESELLKTIELAPDNSIFFYSRETKQLQRLSFNDIYQLDKTASKTANRKKRNLVLNYQGAQNFADKVFKIEEKKPRIAFAVVHNWLGQEGPDEYGMPGMKDALTRRGYESRDIVLRRGREPAALEQEESRYEMLEGKKKLLEVDIKDWVDDMVNDKKKRDYWQQSSFEEVVKEYLFGFERGRPIPVARSQVEAFRKKGFRVFVHELTEDIQKEIAKNYAEDYELYEQELATKQKKLAKAIDEQSKLRVDNLAEQRRVTDIREKMKRLLADVDLLVVPRATYFNILKGIPARGGDRIPPEFYEVDPAQLDAIKDFMRAGKPVMFCLGPVTEPGADPDRPTQDPLEKMLAEFNIELPNQMILYDVEVEAMAEFDERDLDLNAGRVDVPPVAFDWKRSQDAPMPIRGSMNMTASGFGAKGREGLKIRHPRPVYFVPRTWDGETVGSVLGSLASPWPIGPAQALATVRVQKDRKMDEKPVILMSGTEGWNEAKPFPTDRYLPRYSRVKSDDPTKGTLAERRRGPFPIGVAIESTVPMDWYEKDAPKTPTKIRLAVIGHGGLFIGEKLPPMREKLFLDTTNWLLGRDSLLVRDNETWQYPRIELSSNARKLWITGVCFVMPLLFLYVGVCVGLVRQMR